MSSEVAKIAMRHKRRWVDGTDAIVDDVQEVFFASERSITGEILVKVQYEMRFMNVVGTHCGRMRYGSLSSTGFPTDRRNELSSVSVQY